MEGRRGRSLEVVAQRILEQGLRGGGWFLLPDESAFFISDGWGAPSYASMRLRQIDQETLEEIRHARTRDSVRTVVKPEGTGVLVACTFKRILVFDVVTLTELHQISKAGRQTTLSRLITKETMWWWAPGSTALSSQSIRPRGQ